VYAIVRTSGHQEKVAVGDVVVLNRVAGQPGDALDLAPVLLVVDGESVTSDPNALSGASVKAEVVEHTRGKKIDILKYKNKTGYRKRQGHRQDLTVVKVTGIELGA
jgi:large subunit ribosomal protein L21